MKPSREARLYASVTLSKGKMYEYEIPEDEHITIPKGMHLERQFPLAIGTLGDFAAEVFAGELGKKRAEKTEVEELIFASQVLSATATAKIDDSLSSLLRLLAAAGFYLADSPGTTMAILKAIDEREVQRIPNADALLHVLTSPWLPKRGAPDISLIESVLYHLRGHYTHGRKISEAWASLTRLRDFAYSHSEPLEFLLLEVLGASIIKRYHRSVWHILPRCSNLEQEAWAPFLSRPASIKELWPSQRALAEAGVLNGKSAVVQMPTSAGKTKATELIIRAAFRSARTNTAVVVAPFRALCQEIANSLDEAFAGDGYAVNQLSDSLQKDYVAAIFDGGLDTLMRPKVLVITPEKLVYALRQEENFLESVGLLIYDEAHQFDTGKRGATYELLLTSIKQSTPPQTQSVLISAVIGNADELALWLFGDKAKTVEDKARQSRSTIAFTSFQKGARGQLQFQPTIPGEQGFFVPGIIPRLKLAHTEREKPRYFPTQDGPSIALYLGLKLAKLGPVAVYSRLPASASKAAKELITYVVKRNAPIVFPRAYSDAHQLQRLHHLYVQNFGPTDNLSQAANLGVFVHHGETPHGIRLAVEHAMKQGHIRFIACTSTLAQGVNLPIRYLVVNSSLTGRDVIKAREFKNLIGRSGRAGMHEEGTIIFADPRLFDDKEDAWETSQHLIDPDSATATSSTLLELVRPPYISRKLANHLGWGANDLAHMLINYPEHVFEQLADISDERLEAAANRLLDELPVRRAAIEAIESFLMTYRSENGPLGFLADAAHLARMTFAHSLAQDYEKDHLEGVFIRIAERLNVHNLPTEVQHRYGRSLIGLDLSLKVDAWVQAHEFALAYSETTETLLDTIWPLLLEITVNSDILKLTPDVAAKEVAFMWIQGQSFHKIMSYLQDLGAVIQHSRRREKITYDTIVSITEKGFGFEFCLHLAAVKESYVASQGERADVNAIGAKFDLLAKRLKYGLPSINSIAHFEVGFADRVIAQELADLHKGTEVAYPHEARDILNQYKNQAAARLSPYPDFFSTVLARILR
ncbi:DEAD/DEAH box helicase [Achromobacter xylosoxidans]|uniref:DEAD/DEAH box helicase n=2 Tax=Alcaligenes xylosoxydans xylosoxydans TaxID=85698 RepID=A0A424W674_ALCXX|nr:DEAD/DEAH box helicase [Achromobacter xylosoxidans]